MAPDNIKTPNTTQAIRSVRDGEPLTRPLSSPSADAVNTAVRQYGTGEVCRFGPSGIYDNPDREPYKGVPGAEKILSRLVAGFQGAAAKGGICFNCAFDPVEEWVRSICPPSERPRQGQSFSSPGPMDLALHAARALANLVIELDATEVNGRWCSQHGRYAPHYVLTTEIPPCSDGRNGRPCHYCAGLEASEPGLALKMRVQSLVQAAAHQD